MHRGSYIIYWWCSKVEGAGFGLLLPVVFQRQYAHIACEAAAKFVPVACLLGAQFSCEES